MATTWESISNRKRAEQLSRIPKEWLLPNTILASSNERRNVLDIPRSCGLLSPKELSITEDYDAQSLANAISSRQLTSLAVTLAYCKRAAISHQLTNCLTEILFSDALTRAKWLDEYISTHNKPLGPLHGLPISLKDTFKVKGYDATVGFASLAFTPATSNSTLVTILLNAGAILHCKTNVPQTLMSLDTHNNVFGRTLNPLNSSLTAGGSSGGEGALVAMNGSVFGVGTDVGGSIRVPAMCNGLYGVKLSVGRVPMGGTQSATPAGQGRLGIETCAGPISRSLGDCVFFLGIVEKAEAWSVDGDVIFGKWSGTVRKERLSVGVVRGDGVVEILPPVRNVLDEAVEALRKDGVKVVEMDIKHVFSKCQSIANALFSGEGYNATFDALAETGEPLSPWLQSRLKRKDPISYKKLLEAHAKKQQLKTEFLKIWKDESGQQIDAFICPVAPHPVPEIDRWNAASYTSSFNLLDYPAGVVPVRAVRQSDLQDDISQTQTLGGWDRRNRELWENIDRSVYLGSPLCVQVVVPRLQDGRLLEAMAVVDKAISRFGVKDLNLSKL